MFQHVSDWQRQQAEAAAHLSTGMTGTGAYTMTPLDVLCSVFADSSVSSAEMEAALDLYAWDIDKAIEHITLHHHGEQSYQDPPPGITGPDPDELAKGINNIILPGAAPRQPNFGRAGMLARSDSFQHSPRNSAPSSPRWGSRPITPVAASAGASGNGQNLSPYAPSAASNRVCRYYLQGSCLRSDCRYNHDISKAVCRFWLRGHCLKGPDRCDFMHLIPPHLAQDVAAMKMRMDQERRERRERERELEGHDGSVEEEFPSLGVSSTKGKRDPAATRWASAVKAGKPVPTAAMQTFINENPLPGAGEASAHLRSSLRGASIGERQSPRVTLKPPVLLPTLATGSKMSESYAQYRERFLELGAARASCLSKAAESWKRGDGAGAKMWSREAQNHDVERLTAGREASQLIMEERKRLLKEAVTTELNRDGRVDPIADRSAKGKEAGAGLGIVLGITSREGSSQMTPEERCEVAIDLQSV